MCVTYNYEVLSCYLKIARSGSPELQGRPNCKCENHPCVKTLRGGVGSYGGNPIFFNIIGGDVKCTSVVKK